MTENKKNKGWQEDADPTCINKKGKPVARRHHNVAAKGDFQNTLRTPLYAPPECEELPELIEEVQSKRKPGAIARDNSKTAERVGDKEDIEDVAEWAKNPGKTDLEGVDDKKDEQEEEEEPEEEGKD